MKQHLSLLVFDAVTDSTETATKIEVANYGRPDEGTVTISDAELIRALYDCPGAKSFAEGSYYIPACVEIEREDDGRYLAVLSAIPGLMGYGNSPQSAVLAMFPVISGGVR